PRDSPGHARSGPAMIDRRHFIALMLASLGGTVQPRFSAAQLRPKLPRIAFLAPSSAPSPTSPSLVFQAFVDSLHDLGYIESQTIIIESCWANGQIEFLTALA